MLKILYVEPPTRTYDRNANEPYTLYTGRLEAGHLVHQMQTTRLATLIESRLLSYEVINCEP